MHHSREKRSGPVPCVWCRKPTFEFDRRCELCSIAASTPPDTSTYFVFDLDTDRVEVLDLRTEPADVMAELLAALQ